MSDLHRSTAFTGVEKMRMMVTINVVVVEMLCGVLLLRFML